MIWARAAYSALLVVLLPALVARWWWRGRREPGYRHHLGERVGWYSSKLTREPAPVIWLHAVSVGETRAARPLIELLLEHYPEHRILLTHTTPTGRETGRALFGERVDRVYLPYDLPFAVDRFLRHFQPSIGIVMETEVWPNLLRRCEAHAVPTVLVNARLSERSFRGYERWSAFTREAWSGLSAVGAQSEEDGRRLCELGARNVRVTGNLKFDVTPDGALVERGRRWRANWGKRRMLLAASTREGEEALLLAALEALPEDVLLAIVPRHPQRFDAVAHALQARAIAFRRRSVGADARDARVLLGDSMGEMHAYYAACDLAFIGGSLLPLGGQNLIEACALGCPVLLGPYTFNFADAAEAAIASGAALRVGSAEQLMETATRLFDDAAARRRMSEAAVAFAHAHRGATHQTLEMIEAVLEANCPAARSD